MPAISARTSGAAEIRYQGAPGGASDARGHAMLTASNASHATASTLTASAARPSRECAGAQVPRRRPQRAAEAASRNDAKIPAVPKVISVPLARPGSKRRHDRRRDGVDVPSGHDLVRPRVGERDRDGADNHDRGDGSERHPERHRHVPGRASGLLGHADTGVEADEDPTSHRQRSEQCRDDGSSRRRLRAQRLERKRPVLGPNANSNARPTPTETRTSVVTPTHTTRRSTRTPSRFTNDATATTAAAASTTRRGVGSMPARARAHGPAR
jgi:hypothetical protein